MRVNIEGYNGMCVYSEDVQGYTDGYWLDMEEMKNYCECEELTMPKMVLGCKRETLKLDADCVIEDLEQEYAENIEDGDLSESVKKAIREWVRLLNVSLDVDHNCHWFFQDKNVEVVLEEPSDPLVGEKPVKWHLEYKDVWCCSYCGSERELIPDDGEEEDCDKYCHNCGTKIDWSDVI